MAITKIVGAVFKIPLANILGGTGMGYFSTAYNFYSPVFALTAAGVPTVIMRLTAKNTALGRRQNAQHIKRAATLIFSVIGAAGMMLILLLAPFFANEIACSPQSIYAITAISPAVLFCCIGAVIRGYYEGVSDVVPSVAANITEAVSRAAIGLLLSYGVIAYAKICYENGAALWGTVYATYEEAYSAALPYAAAVAILAVTLSELAGLIALLISDKKKQRIRYTDTTPTDRKRSIISEIFKELLPIAAFSLVMNCFSFVDLLTVTRTLDNTIRNAPDYFMRAYPLLASADISTDELANFMYGSYTGIAMSLFMLIPSFAGMTEKTSIPDIAAAWEKRDAVTLKKRVADLVKAASAVGFPACLGAFSLSRPILDTLYPERSAEVSVCINAFSVMCIGGICMILASSFFGIFQAIGKGHIPLWIMTVIIVLKAIMNCVLLRIPQISITGASIATVTSYSAAMIIGGVLLKKHIKGIRLLRPIIAPCLSAILCALAAALTYNFVHVWLGALFSLIIAVFAGAFVYILLLILAMHFRQVL